MRFDFKLAAASARQSVGALALLSLLLACGERIIVGREPATLQTIDDPNQADAGAAPGPTPDGSAGDADPAADDDRHADDDDADDDDDEDDEDDDDGDGDDDDDRDDDDPPERD